MVRDMMMMRRRRRTNLQGGYELKPISFDQRTIYVLLMI